MVLIGLKVMKYLFQVRIHGKIDSVSWLLARRTDSEGGMGYKLHPKTIIRTIIVPASFTVLGREERRWCPTDSWAL
jgi:hypothetical protein